jgi:hypothetical protein
VDGDRVLDRIKNRLREHNFIFRPFAPSSHVIASGNRRPAQWQRQSIAAMERSRTPGVRERRRELRRRIVT